MINKKRTLDSFTSNKLNSIQKKNVKGGTVNPSNNEPETPSKGSGAGGTIGMPPDPSTIPTEG
jgi:hypothetical protein